MKVAALDLGTNTFILLIAEVERGQIVRVIHDEVRVVRLGQGVSQSKRFHPEALQRAEECFERFSSVIQAHRPNSILACATSAARDVANGNELVALASKYRIPVEIISGEREAELTFAGTIRERPTEPLVIIDVGGGSTEYILGNQSGLVARQSLDIGAVRLTERFVTGHPISPIEMSQMSTHIQKQLGQLSQIFPRSENLRIMAVAGTPTTLATVDQGQAFEAEQVDGYRLSMSKIEQLTQKLSSMTVAERQCLAGMEPKRADVIVAGSLILARSGQYFQASEMEVSVRGLRYGIAKHLGEQA